MDMAALATHQGTVESAGTKQSAGNPTNPVQAQQSALSLNTCTILSLFPPAPFPLPLFASALFHSALLVVSAAVVSAAVELVALLALRVCVFC